MALIPNLLTRIVIAEFDIDKGSCIRTQYPEAEPSPDDGYIAEQLLPDGSEKHALGRSYIILGHRRPSSSFSVAVRYARDADALMAQLQTAHARASDEATGMDSAAPPPPALEDILTIDGDYISVRRLGDVLLRTRHTDYSAAEIVSRPAPVEWEGAVARVALVLRGAHSEGRRGGESPYTHDEQGGDGLRGMAEASGAEWGAAGSNGNGASNSTSGGETVVIELFVASNTVEQLRRLIEEYKGRGASVSAGGAPADSTAEMIRYPVPMFAVAATMTKKDATVRRGGITKGVAFIGPDLVQLGAMWPAIERLVKQCCEVRGTDQEAIDAQHAIIRDLYRDISDEVAALRGGSDPIGCAIAEAAVLRYGEAADAAGSAFSGSSASPWLALRSAHMGQPQTVRIARPSISGTEPIRLPLPSTPPWFMPLRTFGVAEVLSAFKDNFASILTALLCGRRIVVKGFGCPSTVVSEAALAIGIVGSCIVPDFITTRVFPYSSITFMDRFISLGAPYVVGTLNPMFDSRTEWWDLLCDLDTGAVTAGISTKMLIAEAPHVEGDRDLCRQLMQYLASSGGYLGHNRDVVEHGVRERIAEYVATVMAAAAHADHAHKMSPAIRAMLEANRKRLMLAQLGGLFDTFVDRHLGGGDIGRVELQLAVAALRRSEAATDEDVIQSLQTILRRIESGAQGPHHLLSVLPQATGGIAPVANQLLSTHLAVRVVALEVLSRIEGVPLGKRAVGCLNSFVLLAYEQIRNDMASLRR